MRILGADVRLEELPTSMVLYAGAYRDEEVPVDVTRLGAGAGEIDCIECDGTGIWTVLPGDGPIRCTSCKGTGRILLSV